MERKSEASEVVNVTGHTAQVDAISRLGKDPAQWIAALHDLEQVEDCSRKQKLIKCFFTRAHRNLNSKEMCRNENYGILLGKEAMLCSENNVENARTKFESALALSRTPIIYIMFAQFEVNNGKMSKAMKILQHGLLSCGNSPEIGNAMEKLKNGQSEICAVNCVKFQNVVKSTQNREVTNSHSNSHRPSEVKRERNSIDNVMPQHLRFTTPGRLKRSANSKAYHADSFGSDLSQSEISTVGSISQVETAVHSPAPNISVLGFDIQSPVCPDISMLSVDLKKSSSLANETTSNDNNLKPSVVGAPNETKLSPVERKPETQSQMMGRKPSLMSSDGPRRILVKRPVLTSDDDVVTPVKSDLPLGDANEAKIMDLKKQLNNMGRKSPEQPLVVAQTPQNVPHHHSAQPASSAFKPYSKPISVLNTEIKDKFSMEDKENQIPYMKKHSPSEHELPLRASTLNTSSSTLQRTERHSFESNLPKINGENKKENRQLEPKLHPVHQLLQEKKIVEVSGVSYIVLKLLGKGGSSKVFQVLNPKTGEIFAVKQVKLVGCDDEVLNGYKNEINFLEKLQGSRYIIKLVNHEIKEQHLYLVMECGSLDLSQFLKKQKAMNATLDIIDILAFWKNMLLAVQAIHKHGIIHLDLKPANFMLVDYRLKLIDFGIANTIQVDATSVIKDTQFGTLNFMAPEAIIDMSGGMQTGPNYAPKFKVGPKADVWSLGCILYYIMYGKTPFQHIVRQAMKLFAITNENHTIEFPSFPRPELVETAKACLTRDPKKRPSVEMLLNHPILN